MKYDDILNKIKEKIKTKKINTGKRDVTVCVFKEVEELSEKELHNIAKNDTWLFTDSGFHKGNISSGVKEALKQNLISEVNVNTL